MLRSLFILYVLAHLPVQPDAIWSLAWTAQNQVITACADGHLRIHDPTQLHTAPLFDLSVHPLAISSLSANASGSRTISVSLDGTAVLADPVEGAALSHFNTAQKHASNGESIGNCPL
jgi:WD repeat-containing protein 61